ncbi:MAG: hypothetical protein ACRDIU_04885 [Actinomycetota bacterium]
MKNPAIPTLRPFGGMFYAEWLYTVRNWKQLAFSYGLALFFGIQALIGLGGKEIFSFPIFVLLFIQAQRATARINEDLYRDTGTIYLRTLISPSQIVAAKWVVESALTLVVLAILVLIFLWGGLPVGPMAVIHLVASAVALTAVVLAATIVLPRLSRIGMPVIIISSVPLLALFDAIPMLEASSYVFPWIGALTGLTALTVGEPIAPALPATMLAESVVFMGLAGARYKKALLRRL